MAHSVRNMHSSGIAKKVVEFTHEPSPLGENGFLVERNDNRDKTNFIDRKKGHRDKNSHTSFRKSTRLASSQRLTSIISKLSTTFKAPRTPL